MQLVYSVVRVKHTFIEIVLLLRQQFLKCKIKKQMLFSSYLFYIFASFDGAEPCLLETVPLPSGHYIPWFLLQLFWPILFCLYGLLFLSMPNLQSLEGHTIQGSDLVLLLLFICSIALTILIISPIFTVQLLLE